MKLGFLTACLPDLSLDEVAAWAATSGFEALEVAGRVTACSSAHSSA
jgi:sugar phosphate isomerase/epimerase